MPYIDKNGKPVLWEETNYFNQYRKALIYYPVKAKRRVEIPDVSPTPTTTTTTPTPTLTPTNTPTPTLTPTNTPTPTLTPTNTPTPSSITYHIEAQNGDLIITQDGDFIDYFPL